MTENVEKKKYIVELKSKIRSSEELRNKLKEYTELLENIINKSSQFGLIIPNLNGKPPGQ